MDGRARCCRGARLGGCDLGSIDCELFGWRLSENDGCVGGLFGERLGGCGESCEEGCELDSLDSCVDGRLLG